MLEGEFLFLYFFIVAKFSPDMHFLLISFGLVGFMRLTPSQEVVVALVQLHSILMVMSLIMRWCWKIQ